MYLNIYFYIYQYISIYLNFYLYIYQYISIYYLHQGDNGGRSYNTEESRTGCGNTRSYNTWKRRIPYSTG